MERYLLGALILISAYILLQLFIKIQQKRWRRKLQYSVLTIQVSKENELGPIVAEQIFATLHGIDRNISFLEKLKGYTPEAISFEIANISRSIKFYIWAPKHLKNLIEGQIYAQYPDVEITETADYSKLKTNITLANGSNADKNQKLSKEKTLVERPLNSLDKNINKNFSDINLYKNAFGAELKLEDPEIYPIKRYSQFEDKLTRVAVDPIAAITATMSKLKSSGEEAWLQVIVQPLEKKWKNVFFTCLRIINKGIFANISSLQKIYIKMYCTRNIWYRKIFFPLYILFWFQGLASGMSKSKSPEGPPVSESDLMEEMSRSHERETSSSAAVDKVSKLLFKTTIRILYLPQHKNNDEGILKINEIAGSFKQFNIPQINGFLIKKIEQGLSIVEKYKKRLVSKENFVLNTEELATIYHLPNKTVSTPNIYWIKSKKMEPPNDLPNPHHSEEGDYTTLGKIDFRGAHDEFGIRSTDRRRHVYIIGKTGMGKSTLLENMIFSDIQQGKGVGVIDPHGDLAEKVLNYIPAKRTNDVIVFDPSDRDFPVAFNMLENINPAYNTIVCSGLVQIFKKLYADSWGPRLEHFLRNTILALLEYPGTTMMGITRMLQDESFRKKVVKKISDPIVKAFWTQEFEKMQERQRIETISPILNKVGQFLSSPIIRNIVGQPKSTIDLRFAMDKGKIIIVNLSKGKIGEDNSSLLGAMMITKFQLDAMSRADIPEKDRKDFYLYVDEFQNFATEAFATILSEARKYRLNLTMANQYISQMSDEVREAVFGNVGTIISFQVGPTDAESLSVQFGEEQVTINDLVNLSKYKAYIKLLVEGMPTNTFSMDTLPPPELNPDENRKNLILKVSRERYATPSAIVEDKIKRWSENNQKLSEPEEKKQLKKGEHKEQLPLPPKKEESQNNNKKTPPPNQPNSNKPHPTKPKNKNFINSNQSSLF